MFSKDMKLAYLLDFYIDLFDEHTAAVMRAYYEDDLSLAEIAAGEGIVGEKRNQHPQGMSRMPGRSTVHQYLVLPQKNLFIFSILSYFFDLI